MKQRGIAPILIVMLIAVLVGGYFVYQNQAKSIALQQLSDNAGNRPTQPSPVSEVTPIATPSTQLPESIKLAQQDLAETLHADPSQISIVKIENIMWNDGSLGCPKQGMMYTQAAVPGYKVIFELNQKQYDYHTNKNRFFVTCQSNNSFLNLPVLYS